MSEFIKAECHSDDPLCHECRLSKHGECIGPDCTCDTCATEAAAAWDDGETERARWLREDAGRGGY